MEVWTWPLLISIVLGATLQSFVGYKTKAKDEFLYTRDCDNGFYLEHFCVADFGVGGEFYTAYLTDSLHFRMFIAKYFDNEYLEVDWREDHIFVRRMYEDKSPLGESSRRLLQEERIDKSEWEKNEI